MRAWQRISGDYLAKRSVETKTKNQNANQNACESAKIKEASDEVNADTGEALNERGTKIDLISDYKLGGMASDEKISMILSEVKKGKVLILERGLNPVEQSQLIERTMREIDNETFHGIEIETYPGSTGTTKSFMRFMRSRGAKGPSLTIIGPANKLKTLNKDRETIQALISYNI
jgi:hypothetical protein